jgi:DNA topoisomerase II
MDSSDALARKYVKLEPRDHVLQRSSMYIGSVESERCVTWACVDASTVCKKEIEYVPGLYKIFDEILTNAIDHATRMSTHADAKFRVKEIRVDIDRETGELTMFNNGQGIDVAIHPEHGIYIPELVFGNLLTSTNYDDTADRMVGGQNGLGAKCANIFAKRFEVETVDASRKRVYTQSFTDNMSRKGQPVVKACAKKPYTRITFTPDYERFGCPGISDDMHALFSKRVYDACALTPSEVAVYLNGAKLEYKTFERYADLYLGARAEASRVYERLSPHWEVIAAASPTEAFEHVTFVNGVWTIKGGRHVEHLAQQIAKRVCDALHQRRKLEHLKASHVRDSLMIFVKASIPNAAFDSQSKETMTTPVAKFGAKVEVSDAFIERLCKSDIAERLQEMSDAAASRVLAKSDGRKKSSVRGIPKLHDAGWAGSGARAKDAVLCLVEGDSAAAMAIAGRSAVPNGAQKYGIFSLKGKPLNVREATAQKMADNAEICAIKKILGLETGKTYEDASRLRYGSVMLLTDQDLDGAHIQGLVCNLFGSQWPSLLRLPGFLNVMLTPIIKASKGKTTHVFYALPDFQAWKAQAATTAGWTIKYYKGLATSNSGEAKDYFRAMRSMTYAYSGRPCDDAMELAFSKKRADDRKAWLERFDPEASLDMTQRQVTYDEFVHKQLVHFSTYDVERSLPNVMDGLKVSQRKILYACFKRNLIKELRVAQLSGWVSECSLYHHVRARRLAVAHGLVDHAQRRGVVAARDGLAGGGGASVRVDGRDGKRLGGRLRGRPRRRRRPCARPARRPGQPHRQRADQRRQQHEQRSLPQQNHGGDDNQGPEECFVHF